MTERQIKLIFGCLLHDVGKIVYRSGSDTRNHCQSGYDFLSSEAGITDNGILNCVKYHHWKMLENANVANDDLCYLSYFADNVAAMIDRREAETEPEGNEVFEKDTPLQTVFNILNREDIRADCLEKKHYGRYNLDLSGKMINYPTSEKTVLDTDFYTDIKLKLVKHIKGLEFNESEISSLLSLLEANLSYVPSSTNKRELVDIPLYDHLKLTAGFASCIEIWMRENNVSDYRKKFITDSKQTYEENLFLLYSMDISGIQSFIYTITSEGALKELRARSLYLEVMMEHLIDELLSRLSLGRTNLIYAGGGHCYMILPNTEKTKTVIEEYSQSVNKWFMDTFDISLYLGTGYAECSANDLRNEKAGSYSEIFKTISRMISEKKLHRYSAEQLRELNSRKHHGDRECKVCRRVGNLIGDRCYVCEALEHFASTVMTYQYFVITDQKIDEKTLPLPFSRWMTPKKDYDSVRQQMNNQCYVRTYTKNYFHMGNCVAQNLWIGDYCYQNEFKELSASSTGIKRIAALRADVDNLGNTFVNGFKFKNDEKYATLTRSAVLSRQLSLFFKGYINKILNTPEKRYLGGENQPLAVTIVYSGGDDVFLVGAWDSVIDAFINLRTSFQKFTQNTLTISGGVGIYNDTYPVNVMAQEVSELEDCSKAREGKNSVTLFDVSYSYNFDEFISNVIGEKLDLIEQLMKFQLDNLDNKLGNSFLYNILGLLRNTSEKINIARLAYLLSRMEPDSKKSTETQKEIFKKFSNRVFNCFKEKNGDKEQCEYFICALMIYVYLNRNEEK